MARGFIVVDDDFRTSQKKVYAIGDAVRPGLLTDAIGQGRRAAAAILAEAGLAAITAPAKPVIDPARLVTAYFDPRPQGFDDLETCGAECVSCGACRDCRTCLAVCPQGAISRNEIDGVFGYVVEAELCIGCGFCAAACPCGVWNLIENKPLG